MHCSLTVCVDLLLWVFEESVEVGNRKLHTLLEKCHLTKKSMQLTVLDAFLIPNVSASKNMV